MNDQLKLRGAANMLHRARMHVGKGHRIDEWGNGRYINPAIEAADCLLRKALWNVQRDLREVNR